MLSRRPSGTFGLRMKSSTSSTFSPRIARTKGNSFGGNNVTPSGRKLPYCCDHWSGLTSIAPMPTNRSAAALNTRNLPLVSATTTPSATLARMSCNRSFWRLVSSSASFLSVMSRKTSTTPNASPESVRIGAALSSMSNSLPFLDRRMVWSARPTIFPSRKTFFTGFSTGRRVSLLTMSKTRSIDFP